MVTRPVPPLAEILGDRLSLVSSDSSDDLLCVLSCRVGRVASPTGSIHSCPTPSLPSLGAAVAVHEQMGKTVPRLRTQHSLPAASHALSPQRGLKPSTLPTFCFLFFCLPRSLSFRCLNKVLGLQSPHLSWHQSNPVGHRMSVCFG